MDIHSAIALLGAEAAKQYEEEGRTLGAGLFEVWRASHEGETWIPAWEQAPEIDIPRFDHPEEAGIQAMYDHGASLEWERLRELYTLSVRDLVDLLEARGYDPELAGPLRRAAMAGHGQLLMDRIVFLGNTSAVDTKNGKSEADKRKTLIRTLMTTLMAMEHPNPVEACIALWGEVPSLSWGSETGPLSRVEVSDVWAQWRAEHDRQEAARVASGDLF